MDHSPHERAGQEQFASSCTQEGLSAVPALGGRAKAGASALPQPPRRCQPSGGMHKQKPLGLQTAARQLGGACGACRPSSVPWLPREEQGLAKPHASVVDQASCLPWLPRTEEGLEMQHAYGGDQPFCLPWLRQNEEGLETQPARSRHRCCPRWRDAVRSWGGELRRCGRRLGG